MSRIRYLIEVYRKRTGRTSSTFTWDSTPLKITEGIALDSDASITSTADGFSFRLLNSNTAFANVIKMDDRVLLYFTAWEDITDANKTDYLRFDGVATEINYTTDESGRMISVKGLNRLERLLNYTSAAVYEPRLTASPPFYSTASDIIQALIDTVNENNVNYNITWDAGNDTIAPTSDTEIQYYRNYRPVIEMISELSKQSINKSFNAYFFLDGNNHFIWKQKSTDTDGLKLTEGQDFKKIVVTERVWDVVNAVIYDAGFDPSNRPIHGMYYDETSAAEYGLKWANTIESFKEIAESLKSRARSGIGWVEQTDQNKKAFSSSYPVTLPWQDRNASNGKLTGSNKVVSSDSEFNAAVRLEAKWLGKDVAKTIIDFTGYAKPRVDIEMSGPDWELGFNRTKTSVEDCLDSSGNPIQVGDKVTIISSSRGGDFSTGRTIRCVSVEHSIGAKGWDVTLRFEIDITDAVTYSASAGLYRDGVKVR